MMEHEWLLHESPLDLLYGIATPLSDQLNRQCRLFAVAVARVFSPNADLAIDVAERYADGKSTWADLLNIASNPTSRVAANLCEANDYLVAQLLAGGYDNATSAGIFRDIFQWPHAPAGLTPGGLAPAELTPGEIDPAWVTPAVADMAHFAYTSRDFTGLPVIADALEEAGCDNIYLLAHLRGLSPCPINYGKGFHKIHLTSLNWACDSCGGTEFVRLSAPHVRGCWALDEILGLRPAPSFTLL